MRFLSPADHPTEQNNNVLLQEAVRALFTGSPLLHTQTLTLEAFPVPDASEVPPAQETLCLLPPNTARKRLTETSLGTEKKRRKSKS